jgi:hypothetical protein
MEADAGTLTAGARESRVPAAAGERTQALSRRERLKPELLPALGAAALAGAISVWVMQLWKADLRVPLITFGDATAALASIKDMFLHGWYLTNPNLAAPFGQQFYDYPAYSGDSLYLLMIKALGYLWSDPATAMNLFFLLCFPLITISAYAVLRRLGISVGPAVVCAVLYTVLPYRFLNSEGHIFLASYFLVPVCCYLVLGQFTGRELLVPTPGRRGPRAYLNRRSAAILLVCALVGSSDNYFAVFTVALMVAASIVAYLALRRRRALIGGLLTAAVVLGVVALNALPTFVYSAEHGKNPAPGHRVPQETEMYGLSLANLVLPIQDHRIPALASLAQRYASSSLLPVRGEASWNSLGIVATLGLLLLVVALGVRCLRGGARGISDARYSHAAMAAALAFLIGTVGGLQTVFAYIVSPRMHAPNRITVFLAFFALFGVALGLDQLLGRFAVSRRRRWAAGVVLAAVLVIGTLDQTSPATMVPGYAAQAAQYHSDSTFVRAIERQLPGSAMVFELPYIPFPEAQSPGRMQAYDEFLGYIHSDRLRWSNGAMEGRPTDWIPRIINQPPAQLLQTISATGFQGIYLDTYGFSDAGASAIGQLTKLLHESPLASPNKRLYFYNITAFNRQLRQRYSAAQIAAIAAAALPPTS